MNIVKLQTEIHVPEKTQFVMQEQTVQGAKIGKSGNDLLIISPRRYKLYTDGADRVKIVEGEGFFKWKRGETKFRTGDNFEISQVGEYEINGKGTFVVLRG